MRKPKKCPSSDEDDRSQRSFYTNVRKLETIPSKSVELCLEVEMDDEVREIIKSPEKCQSALLDVTVIKPKGFEDLYTTEKQTLKSDQVKKLIASMNIDSVDKKALLEKIFGDLESIKAVPNAKKKLYLPKRNNNKGESLRESSVKLEQGDVQCIANDANSVVFSMYKNSIPAKGDKPDRLEQIYATPKTFSNIRSMFVCKNKSNRDHGGDKQDEPCLCQNCAIVGILTDSQKRPFVTEEIPDPQERKEVKFQKPVRKKSAPQDMPYNSKQHTDCQLLFKHLSSRIQELEDRIQVQEEKAVPKEYFKKIITKLVNHLTKLTHYTTDDKNASTSHKHQKTSDKFSKYHVHPIFLDNSKPTARLPAEKEYDPQCCNSNASRRNEGIWKWGEEILKPGIDLKNKIMVLLEDTLHNIKKGWERPAQEEEISRDDMHTFTEQLSKNLRRQMPAFSGRHHEKVPLLRASNSDTSVINWGQKRPKSAFMRKKGTLNIAYVNPKIRKWEESQISFKVGTSDECVQKIEDRASAKDYKNEFIKVIENSKTTDKFKLWQTVWNQALVNGQSKNDHVTVQVPDPKDLLRQRTVSIEYTIGELENLLIGPTQTRKKRRK